MISTNILDKYLNSLNDKAQLEALLEETIFEILALEAENMAQREAIATLEANIQGLQDELNIDRTKTYIKEIITNKYTYAKERIPKMEGGCE